MTVNRDITRGSVESSAMEQWQDKLWHFLFDGDSGGLMSPGQIRREHRNRNQVRQTEMLAILETEEEINLIHQGLKALDEYGNIIDTPRVDEVSTHSIIENTAIERNQDIIVDSPAAMLKSVVKDISVRDLERSLNIRKLAIMADTEIASAALTAISNKPVSADWMLRWRESAQDVFNPELQTYWARLLIGEIAQPGTYSLGIIMTLAQLNAHDLEMVQMAAKYVLGNFIFNASGRYFSTELH